MVDRMFKEFRRLKVVARRSARRVARIRRSDVRQRYETLRTTAVERGKKLHSCESTSRHSYLYIGAYAVGLGVVCLGWTSAHTEPEQPRALSSSVDNVSAQGTVPAQTQLVANAKSSTSSTVTAHTSSTAAAESRLYEAARYLASDELQGRGIWTDGLEKAAEYVAEQFHGIGLNTQLYNGEPFDHFSKMSRLVLGATNEASFVSPKGARTELEFGQDFTPLSFSASKPFDLPLVFVGYGITAPELGYDDYAGIDVKGKAVVVLRHEPEQGDPNSMFNGKENSEHAFFASKVANAVEHGAAALVLCTDQYTVVNKAKVQHEADAADEPRFDKLLNFRVRGSLGDRQIPVLHCRRAALDGVVRESSGKSLAEWETEIERGPRPRSRALKGSRITGEVSVLEKGKTLKNVLGMLEGDGSFGDETIVIGAHYDHLGMGGWGSLAAGVDDEVHNGADDNASGTSALLEIARDLVSRRKQLRRRILFIAFTAEEMGLVGSEHYVADPLVPMKDTVAMLNLDMVGRLRNEKLTVSGVGTASEFTPLVDRFGQHYGFNVTKQLSGYGPSDHASFYSHGVPVMHFFTGLHVDYHRPGDDVDKLNLDGMQRIARMVADIAVELSRADDKPKSIDGDDGFVLSRSQGPAANGGDDKPKGVYLGVISNRAKTKAASLSKGFLVDRIELGSPAHLAGFRRDDVIVELDGKKIGAASEVAKVLKDRKPGERIVIKAIRSGVEIEIEATLQSRS